MKIGGQSRTETRKEENRETRGGRMGEKMGNFRKENYGLDFIY